MYKKNMRHLITKLANMMAMAALLMTATPMMAQEEQSITVDGCRPLLAPDCVVDDIVEQVKVQGSDNTDYTKVLDADLTNYTVISSLANVSALHNPIISIRDLKHKYKGGQKVGFVVDGSGSLLSVEVLQGLTIMLFDDNKQVGEAISISTENFSVLSLNLISKKGQRTIMVDTPEGVEFDEIRLCVSGGADVGLLSSMQIYYGFVGDGEKKLQNTSDTDNSFSSFETTIGLIKKPLKITNPDDSHEDYKIPATILDLASYGNVTVQYNNDKNNNPVYGPKKAEVGFVFSSTSLADIKLFGTTTLRLKKLEKNTEHVVIEKELQASVLDIEVGSGETDARYSMIIDTDEDWNAIQLETGGAGLGVGATYIKYAYVREFDIPEAAERHDLNLSADALLCANENIYTLSSGVGVKWKLVSPSSGANVTIDSGDDYVKKTNVKFNSESPIGTYVFEATDDDGCTGKVTLYRGKIPEMEEATANAFTGTPLDAINDHVALSKTSDGGLLVIDGLEDAENIIDGDLNSYATYAKGLQLAANTRIVSVKKDDGKPFDPAQAAVVGFVAETPGKLLGADVLTFYRIVLYNKGNVVYNSATDTNNVINASLIGAPGSGMIRYAIEVPKGTEFDEFALYTSGVLNLDLTNQSMKIYNAFMADENLVTMPVGPLGSKYVTSLNVDNGARINYAQTGAQTSVVNVVSVSNGLGYLVDNNLTTGNGDEKGMTNYAVAGVLSGSRLAIKTGRQYQRGRWVGLVMKRTPGLADVEVLNLGMTISTALNGETRDKGGTDASLLSNTNIIGWGDYFYVSVYATQPFDEVRFEKGELVQALSELEYLGFYTYADQDMDGIPDEEDPDFCEEDIVIDFSAADINSLCASNAEDKVTATITAKSATQVAYTISDIDRKEVVKSGKLSSADGKFTYIIDFTDPSLLDGNGIPQYGRYELKVTLPDNPLFTPGRKQFTIHATQTRWQPQLTEDMSQYSSDWNEWKNWTQGVPVIGCTDVVIPGNAQSYPVLSPKADDAATDINSCENIHFMTGGEVKGTEYLNYKYASVDFELQAGRYYMLSTPLKATYAGDYFIPAEMNGSQDNDLFTRLNEKNSPENRFSPRIYQRLWEHSAPVQEAVENVTDGNVTNHTTTVNVDETRWTPPFNGLTQPYGFEEEEKMVTGFSLKADAEDLTVTTLKFRMPKEHTVYHYFNDKKQETDLYETINRHDNAGRLKAGRLYTDDLSGDNWNLTLNLELDNASDYFVVGNPFMTHINIRKFLDGNPSIKELKVYDGNAMNSAILSDGELVSNTDGTWTSIAPMQAFFARVETASKTCQINFTKDMLETQPENNQMLLSYQDNENRAMESSNQVMIKAKVGNGASSQALIRFNDHASTAFVNGEDGALLVDNEARPQIQVFTLANNRAADIQQTPQTDHITLGVIMAEPAPLELSLTGDTDWNLYDIKTGMTYSMAGGNIVNLGTVSSSTGRYVLVRDVTAIENIKPASGLTLSRTSHGTISIRTADGSALGECSVYSIDGKLIDSTRGGMSEVELKAAKGICIVKAAKADGTSYVQKM